MIDTKFLLLVLLIGLTGWSSWWLFFATNEQENSAPRQYFFIFLSGFTVFSVCLFLLTFLGYFHWQLLLAVLFGLFLAYAWRFRTIHPNPRLKFLPYLLGCLVLGLTSLGLAKIDKPFESILWADDASVFIGAASKLAQNGSLVYTDPLVLEMSPQERSQLLNNRIPNDKTGNLIRFPGGVRLINSSTGKVGFSFYHLFPAWLALGFQTLGNPGYLHLLALFSILTLITLYFLGESLAGPWVGGSLVCVLFLFYPQSYFSKMPATEILSQLLFLSGLLILTTQRKSSALSFKEQRLLGIIWGSLFLCRLESIYVLAISIILVFSLVPYFSRNQKQWRPLILMLMLFGLLAIYYQILRGEYLYALTSSQISSNGSLVMLGIELLDGANRFTAQHVGLSHLLFAGRAS